MRDRDNIISERHAIWIMNKHRAVDVEEYSVKYLV